MTMWFSLCASFKGLQKFSRLGCYSIRKKFPLRLQDGRVSRGALLLSSPEVKFVNRDNNGTDVLDVEMYQSLESNSTVEEFMLLANICVANKIWSSFPSLAMLRRHAPPDPAKWNLLLKHLSAVGVKKKKKKKKKKKVCCFFLIFYFFLKKKQTHTHH